MLDLRVAGAQVSCVVGDFDRNLETHRRFSRQAAEAEAHVICFPELSLSGYPLERGHPYELARPLHGELTEEVQRLAEECSLTILAGMLELSASGLIYNTQVVATPGARLRAYRKAHVPTSEVATFAAGDELPVFELERARIGVQICYDSHFPEASTTQALRGAEVIFFPHASGGADVETAVEKRDRWLRYLAARAYDNRVFALAVNQSGHTGEQMMAGVTIAIDPQGEVIASAASYEEELTIVDFRQEALLAPRRVLELFHARWRRPELYQVENPGISDA
jgi:predicted amidohydrolase